MDRFVVSHRFFVNVSHCVIEPKVVGLIDSIESKSTLE